MQLTKTKEFWKKLFARRMPDYVAIFVKKRPWLKKVLVISTGIFLVVVAGFYYYLYYFSGFKFEFLNKPGSPVRWYLYTGGLTDDYGKPLDFGKIGRSDFEKASYVYSSGGQIIGLFSNEVRNPIKVGEAPEIIKQAFIAAEDKRFYFHGGVDWRAVGRAQFFNLLHPLSPGYFPRSGASTITSQVVRQIYAGDLKEFRTREQSYWRKIKEARIAIRVEKKYSKEKILEAFLNLPYFDHGVNGISEAMRRYFGKDIRKDKIELREVAMLAAMNKNPTYFCPIYHEPPAPKIEDGWPDEKKIQVTEEHKTAVAKEHVRIFRTRDRENYVLEQMLKRGFITREQHDKAFFSKEEPLQSAIIKFQPLKNSSAGYITRMAKEWLFNAGFQDDEITRYAGYSIRTCTDIKIQKILDNKMSRHLAELNSELEDKSNPIDGSAVVMEVETGCVVALSGGHDYAETPFNRAMALRSIGSGFKIFSLGKALEDGKHFADLLNNRPFSRRGANGKTWSPQNFHEDKPVPFGLIPFKVAFIRSVNLPTLRQAEETGPDRIVDFCHRLGVWGYYGIVKDPDGKVIFRMPNVQERGEGLVPLLPTAIGASDVNLLETANAIAAIFRGGQYLPPKIILEVKDTDGKVVFTPENYQPRQTIPKETAHKIMILKRGVAEVGTAKISMRNDDEAQQYAVKTGTSQNSENVFMGGGSPKYVMAMRFGHDGIKPIRLPRYMKRKSQRSDLEPTGGWVVGFIFREIMDEIHAGLPVVKFPDQVETGTTEMLANYPDRYK